jgi:UDP-glucose 4-epimerase
MASSVLVTGGAGFIGSHLVRRLVGEGHCVRVLDDLSTGRRARLAGCEHDIEFLEGDLRRPQDVIDATRGVEIAFHQGALPSVARSVADPRTTLAVNTEGTLNVLLAAREAGSMRVVLASSSSVYGETGPLPRVETTRPGPLSPYAVSKLAAEGLCASFSRAHGLHTVCLRYFNVFGPGQDPSSAYAAVVPRFMSAIADGREIEVNGDGEQTRDFTYVDDVVEANLLAGTADLPAGSVLNVAAGRSTTVNLLAAAVGEVLGRPVHRLHRPARPQEVEHSWADVARAREWLGHASRVELEEGLRRTAAAFLRAGAAPVA